MISAKPYPGHPELEPPPHPAMATVEFTREEVIQALFMFLQTKIGVDGPVRITMQYRVVPSKGPSLEAVGVRLTYWPDEGAKP